MKEDKMLMCLIAFVLGYLVSRMIRGNGLSVGGKEKDFHCPYGHLDEEYCKELINIYSNDDTGDHSDHSKPEWSGW